MPLSPKNYVLVPGTKRFKFYVTSRPRLMLDFSQYRVVPSPVNIYCESEIM